MLRKDGGWVPNQPRPTTNAAYGFQIWSGALSNNGAAALLANLDGNASRAITFEEADLPANRTATAKWDIVEAFTGVKVSGVELPHTATVPPHDVAMWVMSPSALA